MGDRFEIERSFTTTAAPATVWAAVTDGTAGWLWPVPDGSVGGGPPVHEVREEPCHLLQRVEGPDGWFNELEHRIEGRDGGSACRYAHRGVLPGDGGEALSGVEEHTDFYLHTLRHYVERHPGAAAGYASGEGPAGAGRADALEVLRDSLGVPPGAATGDRATVDLPLHGAVEVELDYLHPHFLGMATAGAAYRVFGRQAFGHVLGFAVHVYDGSDAAAEGAAWETLLRRLFG